MITVNHDEGNHLFLIEFYEKVSDSNLMCMSLLPFSRVETTKQYG